MAENNEVSLLINELYASPSSTETEWLEIYNASTEKTIDLLGWQIAELTNGVIKNHLNLVSENYLLAPGAYFWWQNPGSKITFNNGGDTIYLINNTGVIIDQITYPSLTSGQSYLRSPDGSENWFISNNNLTPGTSNPLLTANLTPTISGDNLITADNSQQEKISVRQLQLSEIMSCPASNEKEWLEIYNPNEESITIKGWVINNQKGTTRKIAETVLAGQQYQAIELSSGVLNNSGDVLTVWDAEENEIFQAELGDCSTSKNQSWIYDGEKWRLTNQVTKGKSNIYVPSGVVEVTGGEAVRTEIGSSENETLLNDTTTQQSSTPDRLTDSQNKKLASVLKNPTWRTNWASEIDNSWPAPVATPTGTLLSPVPISPPPISPAFFWSRFLLFVSLIIFLIIFALSTNFPQAQFYQKLGQKIKNLFSKREFNVEDLY